MLSDSIFRFFVTLLFCFPYILNAQTPDTVILCSESNYMVSNALSGVVYDSGGPLGNYQNYEDCELLIDAGCASSVIITRSSLNTEYSYDQLSIYNADNHAESLGTWQGILMPDTFEVFFSRIRLVWHSDGSEVRSGFEVSWQVKTSVSVVPELSLSVSDTFPALLQQVQFMADPGDAVAFYTWDFGDGNTGSGMSPAHQFTSSGQYTITCIAETCDHLTDTAGIQVTVQPAPGLSIDPGELAISYPCQASPTFSFTIRNNGAGEMIFSNYFENMPVSTVVNPSTGVIPPDSSVIVSVGIPGNNIAPGNYQGQWVIVVNDGSNEPARFPVALEVTPITTVSFPSGTLLDFNPIRQFQTQYRYLKVFVNGCLPMQITRLSTDNPLFSVDTTPVNNIYPGSFYNVLISCFAQDTGVVTGRLLLETNAGNFSIDLIAHIDPSPAASITPDNIDVTLSCGDSVSSVIYLKNTGLADLTISPVPAAAQIKVLLLNTLSYNPAPAYNIAQWIQSINQGLAPFFLSNSPAPENLSAEFDNADMVVLPALYTFGIYTPEQIKSEIERFVNRGGNVLITGSSYAYQLENLGIFQMNSNFNNFYGQVFYPLDPQNPFVENIDFQNNISNDNIYGIQILDSDYVPVIRQSGYDVLGYRPVGKGKVIFMAHENVNNPLQNQLLVHNIYWQSVINWLDYELPAIIPAGDSVAVTLHFQSEGLTAGDYNSGINFTTNDPQQYFFNVPVNLHVKGNPELVVPDNDVQFNVMQQFTTQSAQVEILNDGCDTLFLENFLFSSGDFSVVNPPAFVLPQFSATLQLSFHPQSAGNYQDTMMIQSDGGNQPVILRALVVGAPIAQAIPGFLDVEMDCDQTNDFQITLSNSGLGAYQYSLTHSGPARVATLHYGANFSRLYNIEMNLQANGAHVIPVQGNDPAVLADSLKNADILVIPDIEIFEPVGYAALGVSVHAFLDRGGVVLMTGAPYKEALVQMSLIDGAATLFWGSDNLLINHLKSHPLAGSVASKVKYNDYQSGIAFSESDGFIPVIKLVLNQTYESDYLSWKKKGNGFLVWWGQPFDYPDTLSNRLLQNILAWAYQPLTPGTVLPAGQSGSVPVNGAQPIPLTISGNDLPGNNYPGQIRLYGNDPVHNPLIIPVLLQITDKPCAAFSAEQAECSGQVAFKDETLTPLTSWYWVFGDGFDSFGEHPVHTYTVEGTYTVTMVGCNSAGCDSTAQTITIDGLDGPAIACPLETGGVCCNTGIYSFQLGDIDQSSADAATEGYRDFSCSVGTALVAGDQYEVKIVTGNQISENTAIWIDLNNNGEFTANEKLFDDINIVNHEGYLIVPNYAVKEQRIRMRVVAGGDLIQPCGTINIGQAEDYYVVVKQPVGTMEATDLANAALSPNPSATDSRLVFSAAASETAFLTVVNAAGQIVESRTIDLQAGEQQIVLPHRAAGTYTVRLQTAGSTLVRNWVCLEK